MDPLVVALIPQAAVAVYFVACWSKLGGGRTPGMRLLRIHVVGTNRHLLTLRAAFVRYVVLWLGSAALGLGLYPIVLSRSREG